MLYVIIRRLRKKTPKKNERELGKAKPHFIEDNETTHIKNKRYSQISHSEGGSKKVAEHCNLILI